MKTFVIGIGGVTNGGKTTLANKLHKSLPNCSLVCQDDYFKSEADVETDERGFKMYDVLEALNMDDMMTTVNSWTKHSKDAETTRQNQNEIPRKSEDGVYFLIIEGFLLYSYMPLDNVFNKKYFLTIPYEECKKRRSTRVYEPPDPPGYFDGHVWPMYLKHKDQMEKAERGIVYLDGTKLEDDIYSFVYADIRKAGLHWGSWCQARSVSLAGIPLCCNWALLQLTGRCEEQQHPTAPHSGSQPIPQILNPGLLGGT